MTIYNKVVKQIFDFVNYDFKNHILRVQDKDKFKDFYFFEGEDRNLLISLINNKKITVGDEIIILATKRKDKKLKQLIATNLLNVTEGKQLNLEHFL